MSAAVSPPWVNPFQAPRMTGSFFLGFERPRFFKPTYFTRAASRLVRLNVGIFRRQFMTFRAMCPKSPLGHHGLSGCLKVSRSVASHENFMGWAPLIVSTNKGGAGNAEISRPLGKREGFVVKCYSQIIPAIIGLVQNCGPAAVFRFIVAVRVYAIQRLAIFWKSNVIQKVFKALPAGADANPTTAIVLIPSGFRFGTSHFHAHPNSVSANTSEDFLFVHTPTITQHTVYRQPKEMYK